MQCPDNNCTSRHILNGRGGHVKFATGSTDIRCEILHGQLRALLRALPNETHEARPTCFSCTNPTMNLFYSVSFSPPRVSLFSPLPHLLTAFACGPVCPDSLFSLSPFYSHAVATVCSPGTPPGPSVTTYVSFRDGLTVHGENRVPLVVAIFTSDNIILDKALAPAAKVSRFKNGYGLHVTHTRLANSTIGTKFRTINGNEIHRPTNAGLSVARHNLWKIKKDINYRL